VLLDRLVVVRGWKPRSGRQASARHWMLADGIGGILENPPAEGEVNRSDHDSFRKIRLPRVSGSPIPEIERALFSFTCPLPALSCLRWFMGVRAVPLYERLSLTGIRPLKISDERAAVAQGQKPYFTRRSSDCPSQFPNSRPRRPNGKKNPCRHGCSQASFLNGLG